MIFILIVHCAKGKKMKVKKSVYIRPVTRDVRLFVFLVYRVKNDGNCGIAIKERKPFQKNAIVKLWRKRQSGESFVLGKSVIWLIKLQSQTAEFGFDTRKILATNAL